MKNPLLTVFASLLAFGTASLIHAASIVSVNYTPEASVMSPEELAGAPGVRTGYWNNALTLGANTSYELVAGSIMDNQGIPVTGLGISLFTGNAGSTSQRGNPPGGTAPALVNDGRMFRTVTDKFEGAEGSISITGIPYAKYSLYFYVYPDSAGGGERGGYFTVTNGAGVAQTRWLKGGTGANQTIPLPNPDTGEGYIQSKTATKPSTFADIQAGHYVVLSDLTDANIVVYYSAVGSGAGGVTGGDTVRRLKFSGFQITEATTAALTGLSLATPIPMLYTGNPQSFTVPLVGNYSDGSTAPLGGATGVSYASSDLRVFTVSSQGQIQPGQSGNANLEVRYQTHSLTQQVSVIGPVAVRPILPVDPLYRGARNLQVTALADFPDGQFDVNVTRFAGVAFSGGPASVVTVSTNGLLNAVGEGAFTLSATYAGVQGQNDAAGTVLPYDPPQPEDGKLALSFNLLSGQAMAFDHLSGAPGVRVGYWNNIAGLTGSRNTVTLDPAATFDSAGQTHEGLRVSVTGGTGGPSTRGTQSGNESTMFYGVYDQYNGIPGSIQITGLPFANYDAYFYVVSGDADNRPGHFSVGEQTRWVLNTRSFGIPDNDGAGYVESVTTNTPISVAEIEPGNYVRFPNLSGTSLNVQFVADGADVIADADASAPRLKFSGFQIIGVPAPALKAARVDASHIRISWPASATGYVLKSNTVLNGAWNAVGTTPTADGNNLTVTVPVDASGAYFILHKP